MEKKNILRGAVVLLITASLIFSTLAVTADTNEETTITPTDLGGFANQVQLSHPTYSIGDRDILWDQYDTDGSNGLSHADVGAFGYQRALLDDFQVPEGETWILTDLHSFNLWNTLQPGSGTDFCLEIWSDNGGIPGSTIAAATTVSYTETGTGRTWFSRPEFELDYQFEPITLTEGTYWIWGFAIGPENCFWMAKQDVIWGTEAYCDYADYPPIQPGSNIFGAAYDLAFQLTGTGGGQPEVPDLDCSGDLDFGDVETESELTATITVENIGDAGSLLDWEVESYPEWGTWTFDPDSGTDLEEGSTDTIDVTVIAPTDQETQFTGEVVLVNSEDSDDTCTIQVSLTTPVSQSFVVQFFERLVERFPLIGFILEVLF